MNVLQVHIVPFIKRFKANPVTGETLEARQLTKLTVHKNSKGEPHCPVLFKVFNNNTHIVAIKSTGNVFSYEVTLAKTCPTSEAIFCLILGNFCVKSVQ